MYSKYVLRPANMATTIALMQRVRIHQHILLQYYVYKWSDIHVCCEPWLRGQRELLSRANPSRKLLKMTSVKYSIHVKYFRNNCCYYQIAYSPHQGIAAKCNINVEDTMQYTVMHAHEIISICNLVV